MSDKQAVRAQLRTCRAQLDEAYMRRADSAIAAAAEQSEEWKNAGRVFLYVSTPGEPETRTLLRSALRCGKAVYVPKCHAGGRMDAVRILSEEELRLGAYGIPEPPDEICTLSERIAPHNSIALSLIPCLSVTPQGIRLGHGAGYYDRFLPQQPSSVKMCLCYGQMMRDTLPFEPHDLNMDIIVNEFAVFRPGVTHMPFFPPFGISIQP